MGQEVQRLEPSHAAGENVETGPRRLRKSRSRFGVFVPKNRTRDLEEMSVSPVHRSTVGGRPDADGTTSALPTDVRKPWSMRTAEGHSCVTRSGMGEARSARLGAGDPVPNERGRTLPSWTTEPRAETESKRAKKHTWFPITSRAVTKTEQGT